MATVLGMRSYKIVPAQSYAVRTTFGQLVSDHLPPGFYGKFPFKDTFDIFSNNTIIVESSVGSKNIVNTSDRNKITANIRTHYRVDPRVGSIALKLPTMRDDNGKKVFEELENQSFDAVVGSRPASETLDDPQGFLKAYLENLRWRIAQNNMPIRVDVVELLEFQADVHKPIQFRIKSDGHVEAMAGPAAVSVMHGDVQAPFTAPIFDAARPGDGRATRSAPLKVDTTPVQP